MKTTAATITVEDHASASRTGLASAFFALILGVGIIAVTGHVQAAASELLYCTPTRATRPLNRGKVACQLTELAFLGYQHSAKKGASWPWR